MQSDRLSVAAPTARRRFAARTIRALVLALGVAALSPCCTAADKPPVVVVHAAQGDQVVKVELALTREQQMQGLMYRTDLAEDAGMLFVFPEEQERTFWMRNTPLPLDIVYLKGDASILSIAANTTPYSENTIPSRGPARYVLEVRGGWAARHGVRSGDRVTLPDLTTAGRHAAPGPGSAAR